MLLHPSSAIDSQVHFSQLIAAWSTGSEEQFLCDGAYPSDDSGRAKFDPNGLEIRLRDETDLWKLWLDHFEECRQKISALGVGADYLPLNMSSWSEIEKILLEEIFPYVSIRVINSNPNSDDRPQFRPIQTAQEQYRAAEDLLTVFVSGNVMSRGITLEGLVTSVFLRSTGSPAADTQAQMQRWLGYRGKYLHFCRVFATCAQIDLFRAYHENDEALKEEVLERMNQATDSAPSPLVLQGAGFRATGKIANLRALPLCPGHEPFIRIVDSNGAYNGNISLIRTLLETRESDVLSVSQKERGLIFNEKFSLLEVADLLEAFQFTDHAPDPSGPNHARWDSLSNEMGLAPPESPLFRVHNADSSHKEIVTPKACPYSIAAYLRLWKACLTRRARGLFPTDDRRTPWAMINLSLYAATAPEFNVGIRFGSEGLSDDPILRSFGVKCMKRQLEGSIVQSTWGSRNPGDRPDAYLGDHFFDYHRSQLPPPIGPDGEASWRPRGHPALLLFHLLKTEAGVETLTAGICLPLGGPDHFAAIKPPETARAPMQ